jgi:hypothetical protein
MDVLDRIERSLHESLRAAPEPPPVAPPGAGAAAGAMQALDTRLARWQACLDLASQEADRAEQAAVAEEASLGEWIGQLAAAREKLASHAKKPG